MAKLSGSTCNVREIYLSVCLSESLPVCPFVCLYICLSARPSVCVSRRVQHCCTKSFLWFFLSDLSDASSAETAQQLRVCGRIRELVLSFMGEAEAREVVETVASKYLALNRPALAAAVFAETGMQEKALRVFMDSGEWEEARALALKAQNVQLTKALESGYKDFLRTQGKVEQVGIRLSTCLPV